MSNRAFNWLIVWVLATLVTIVTLPLQINKEYQIEKDTLSWQAGAQVAADADDMYEYLLNLQHGMQKWHMTEGHTAYIFHTPQNDMAYIYRSVTKHVERARVLTQLAPSDPAYQSGLDDLRGSLRELPIPVYEFWRLHDGKVLFHVLAICGTFAFSKVLWHAMEKFY